jgi:DNA modification methylase
MSVPDHSENDDRAAVNGFAVEWWPVDRPQPYPKNARKISDRAVEKVAASIREYGWQQPIVVDREEVIIVGHVRQLGARHLGLAQVPVHVAQHLSPAQVRAYRLADNRTNQETDWDLELLGPELRELKALDWDMGLTGFDSRELDQLLHVDDERADDAPPLSEVAVSRLGDLWLLGRHRLLCGDATDGEDLRRLMASEAADLVFTDPPYNVDYEGYTEERLKIKGDRMSEADFKQFLEAAFRSCRTVVKSGASLYVCHSSSWQREFQNGLESAGFEVRCQIIWAKSTFAWGFGRYKFQHEPLFYAHVAGQKDPWYGDKSQSTLWEEKKPATNRIHPTAKPVELVERALLNSSKAGDIVADLFGGSGSTLIGCERRGRKGRLMEVDPKYCDVIVKRWQDFTGKGVILDGTNRGFDDVAAERLPVVA